MTLCKIDLNIQLPLQGYSWKFCSPERSYHVSLEFSNLVLIIKVIKVYDNIDFCTV